MPDYHPLMTGIHLLENRGRLWLGIVAIKPVRIFWEGMMSSAPDSRQIALFILFEVDSPVIQSMLMEGWKMRLHDELHGVVCRDISNAYFAQQAGYCACEAFIGGDSKAFFIIDWQHHLDAWVKNNAP